MRDYIALAIPVFFAAIGAELLWARRCGRTVYRLGDALTDISCGVMAQVAGIFFTAAQLALYGLVHERLRLFTLPSAWMAWLVAFVGVDLAYYWWHRASHEVNALWAAHVVHHQSEDYNLAVALRQSVLTSWTALPFYLPLALLGVPTLVFATVLAFSTLYQFWIHTQLIRPLRGPLDYVLNLPSHHRVHHAVNPRYLDRNYGATLIVWDRWFGTFEPESEPPVYGITTPLASFNPWWAQVHYWVELVHLSRAAPAGRDKLRVFFKPPWWRPPGVPVTPLEEISPATYRKHDAPLSRGRSAYLLAQYALLLIAASALLFHARSLPALPLALAAGAVLVGVLALGALIERKRWGIPLELARLATTLVVTLLLV